MKIINPDPGFASYRKIFKEMQDQKQKVIFWQVLHGHRTVCETALVSYNLEQKILNFLPPKQDFILSHPIFFYVEDQQVIFKANVDSRTAGFIVIEFPKEVRLLDEESEVPVFLDHKIKTFWGTKSTGPAERINDFVRVKSMKERSSRDQDFLNQEFDHVSLDEEDKLFADKRESPRVRPKADKLVKIMKKGDTKIHIMKLFDLSQGGLGFLTYNPDQFPKDTEIFVMGFDAFELDDPLIGIIVAQRAVDAANVEFKIGVKFNEGQE